MFKVTVSDIDHFIDYVRCQEEEGWTGTLVNIAKRYKSIISELEYNDLYVHVHGLRYNEIDDSVKGSGAEFGVVLLNLKTLKDRLLIYESEKNEIRTDYNIIRTGARHQMQRN